jgi:adenine-specific DNA-methyltransferase
MPDKYDNHTREELPRLLRERDRKPRFGLLWERDEIDHDRSVNTDSVALDLDPALSHGAAPFDNLIIEADNFDALRHGVPLMLVQEESGRFMTVRHDPRTDKNHLDQVFRIAGLPGY